MGTKDGQGGREAKEVLKVSKKVQKKEGKDEGMDGGALR